MPYVADTYAYPYISLVNGPDPKYRFERHFLQRVPHVWRGNGWVYFYMLPIVGVYKVGVKRWDCDTQELLSREVSYLIFDGDDIEDISRENVMQRFAS
ncbi:MAG: hypothetical protein KBS74_07800 [Clostridiales bacterium]|nr:hypothetical protein [Candidatus Cacconaster stercorequi]